MTSFLVALAFLTILPIRFRKLPSPQQVARSRFWYPVVGLLLGLLLGGWTIVTAQVGSPLLGAFLGLTGWVAITGMLHVDGFCDLCDGLFAGSSAQDRLRIMKDPHIGSFALTGGALLLLGKFAALHEILARSGDRAPWIVGTAVVVARCLVLIVAGMGRYPRADGTGKVLVEATSRGEAALFTLLACGLTWALLSSGRDLWPMVPFIAALSVVAALTALCCHQLGGVTGDCLGAGIEVSELTFLLAAVLVELR